MMYSEVGRQDFDDINVNGGMFGTVTTEPDGVLGRAIRLLAEKRLDGWLCGDEKVLLTVEECWSGYSDYTITSTWAQAVVSIPSRDVEIRFERMGAFFTALAEADQ